VLAIFIEKKVKSWKGAARGRGEGWKGQWREWRRQTNIKDKNVKFETRWEWMLTRAWLNRYIRWCWIRWWVEEIEKFEWIIFHEKFLRFSDSRVHSRYCETDTDCARHQVSFIREQSAGGRTLPVLLRHPREDKSFLHRSSLDKLKVYIWDVRNEIRF